MLMRFDFSISMKDITCAPCLQVYLHGWNRFWKLALRELSQTDISKCQHFLLLCHWLLMCFQNDLVLSWVKKKNGNWKKLISFIIMQLSHCKTQFIAKNSPSFLLCYFKCPTLNRKCYKNVCPHSKRFKWLTIKWKTVKHVTLARVPRNIYLPTVVFFGLFCCFIGLYYFQLCLAASMRESNACSGTPGRKKATGDNSQTQNVRAMGWLKILGTCNCLLWGAACHHTT